jgi:hypothetical protein
VLGRIIVLFETLRLVRGLTHLRFTPRRDMVRQVTPTLPGAGPYVLR